MHFRSDGIAKPSSEASTDNLESGSIISEVMETESDAPCDETLEVDNKHQDPMTVTPSES